MSVGCEEPGIWGKFQSAAGEKLQNSVRAREIRRNNMVRLTLAARRLVLVMAKNSVYASYTFWLVVEDCWYPNRNCTSDNTKRTIC